MQVGISFGRNRLTVGDVRGCKAIGAEVVKLPCNLDSEGDLNYLPYALQDIRSIGATPIVDLRVAPETIRECGREGRMPEVYEDLQRAVTHVVGSYHELCRDWEWWGEAHCPVVTGAKFDAWQYGETLKIVHAAAHEADPTCRVWTGGFGMNLGMSKHPSGIKFLRRLVEAGCERAFEVCNLHPYAHGRMLDVTVDWHRGVLTEMRRILNRECAGQPFATSEFGFPTVPRVPKFLHSNRVDLGHGVLALTEREAPDWFDAMLNLFREFGFRAVAIHTLDDGSEDHWGHYCGLRRRGWFGRTVRKPQWYTIRDWGQSS
jgi:hypothetical protein